MFFDDKTLLNQKEFERFMKGRIDNDSSLSSKSYDFSSLNNTSIKSVQKNLKKIHLRMKV